MSEPADAAPTTAPTPAAAVPLIPFEDRMLDPQAAAEWLGISVDLLLSCYRKKKIPGIAIGHRTVRFHVKTVTEHFKPAGVR